MTRDIDLNIMTNDKEILEEFRERLELEIKDTFVWALGESAITEMTRTVREKEPTSLPLNRLYSLFRIHFIPERNKHHSRADFFNIIQSGHLQKAKEIDETCFVSPAVITVKRDKSIKIALDSRKLNDITVKKKAQMPNMEELLSRISRKISDGKRGEIWISKLDLDYAYGQVKLSEKAKKLCLFTIAGGKFTGFYQFLKGF